MKKKVVKNIGLLIFIVIAIIALCNIYTWIVSGKQYIKISTSNKAYTNSDLYVSIIAQEKGVDLDTKAKLKLINSKGKKVKDVKVKYEENSAILSIPEIEAGNYFLEAKVSSKAGKDTIKKDIYISDGNSENVTITFDKGIYKPGDTVNYRALLTKKENDEPVSQDINVSIYDGNDNKVYNENIKSSDYGIVSGNLTLASEVNSGLYKLVVKTDNNETTKEFKVNPYVTPKYEVKVNYDKENYLVGETAKITFNAKYFFGEAVENAELVVYVDNQKCQTLKTDSEGIASMNYEIKNAKEYNVKVEAVDSSNYFVETTSSFIAQTDIFEIQLLPEYGTLAAGKKNDVYVFTNKADGTPLKTYVTVSSDNFTKQIATDENGIGKFSIDIDETSNTNRNYEYNTSKSTKQFDISAEDEEGNKVNKNLDLKIEKKNLLTSTDKVKYEQGEDIKINISSTKENIRNIYLFKDDKLLKMVSTDSEDTTVNLDDTYGLIDIYVTESYTYKQNDYITNSIGSSSNKYNIEETNTYKKTIFIKPTKQLNIDVSTDKEEYKPGEKISISFDATDENNSKVDVALLVSMLDDSVLSLANNDLSIDNIKLALQNIKFSNELDAATLYSYIVDDSSEQALMALLLKQDDRNIGISEDKMYNSEQEKKAAIISLILTAIIIIAVVITIFVKNKKPAKTAIKHIINFIMFDLLLVTTSLCIIYEYFYETGYTWWLFAITTGLGLISYILIVFRLKEKVFRTSISIIITILLVVLVISLIIMLDLQATLVIITITVTILLILSIFAKISEIKNLKIYRYMKFVAKEMIYILKYAIALIISIFIGRILRSIIPISGISVPIVVICLYFFNYIFNISKKEKNGNRRTTGFYIVVGLAIIGIMAEAFIITNAIISYSTNWIIEDVGIVEDLMYLINGGDEYIAGGPQSIDQNESDSFRGPASSTRDDGYISEVRPQSISKGSSTNKAESTEKENNKNKEETVINDNENKKETVIDDNVRNIFLESMCFIPELVTHEGTAKLDLDLSDNITTWTIQTVGNTKDGKIGYGILENVKVFKEFFADFELPKNLVEEDNVSIPVTVYNYTDSPISTTLKITEEEWFKVDNNEVNVNIDAKSTNMVYIPISILKAGNNKFRVEISSNSLTDIVEKECTVSAKGYKVEKVVSTGNLDEDITEDILVPKDIVENTAKAKVKIYSSTMSQAIEGMENILKMPTGCFEQISSSLYPDILALKYLEDNGIVDKQIKEKALSYISSGYQKLLTYEVEGESGGYSLYGYSPAETVLTAYGLMEVTDLSKVYNVDNNVIEKMTDFLYKKQNSNGTFTITGSHIGGASSRETLSLNAYIIWALSESNPNDGRLNKSVEYLKGKLDDIDDNYTLALVANVLANVKDKELKDVLKRLVNNINLEENNAYITSKVYDYYGTSSNIQTIQTVALTSMALSKGGYNQETNKLLVNYLINKKDTRGTWYNTQATTLALKALNEKNEKTELKNQTINVKINSDEQKIEIKDNPLQVYELTFENLNEENKLNIDIEKGNAYYEIIEEYYLPYEKVDTKNDKIEVSVESNNNLNVNEIMESNVKVINRSNSTIINGMVTISIPQGFTVIEESLMLLETKGIIEKYETTYTGVNIYLRNFEVGQIVDLGISFRASYPVKITGMAVRAYDYYNPDIEGKSMPIEITVN